MKPRSSGGADKQRETTDGKGKGKGKAQPKLATTHQALPEHRRWADEGRSQRMA